MALAVALFVVGWLVVNPAADGGPRAGPSLLGDVWPAARVVDGSGRLADGADYTPWLYVDAQTSVGTAPSPDGSVQRVVLRGPDGERDLHRVDSARYPQFLGFTLAGDVVYWAESTTTATGSVVVQLWRAPVRGDATPAALTADTGEAVFLNSEFDLLVADGRLYWAAVAAPVGGDTAGTEIRSVPVEGGVVDVRRMEGQYQLAAWPWLRAAASSRQPLELFNRRTGSRITVGAAPTELLECSPTWCRSLVTAGADGTALYDVMRVDGTDRRRVGGSAVTAACADVALLDRFEPVMVTVGDTAETRYQRLGLYDIDRRVTVTVADDVGMVLARHGWLWWQTGRREAARWHALDLTAL